MGREQEECCPFTQKFGVCWLEEITKYNDTCIWLISLLSCMHPCISPAFIECFLCLGHLLNFFPHNGAQCYKKRMPFLGAHAESGSDALGGAAEVSVLRERPTMEWCDNTAEAGGRSGLLCLQHRERQLETRANRLRGVGSF